MSKSNNIVIVDYGLGNLKSIENMIRKSGYKDVEISNNIVKIENARNIILPGVGKFDYAMSKLKELNIDSVIKQKAKENSKILGICLGAQLLTKSSEEGVMDGLGLIQGKTVAFDHMKINGSYPIPHMGWSRVTLNKEQAKYKSWNIDSKFYHVHSYHLVMQNLEDVLCSSNYGYKFCSGFSHKNICGVQFHPEKSHKYGIGFFKDYFSHK